MIEKVKIDGIYDERSLLTLEGLGISDIGFDFRPKSLNFLQAYRLVDLMKSSYLSDSRYYLHFSNEKNYMIEKCLNDLKEGGVSSLDNFVLEFSDYNDALYYDQFKMPYFWHYNSEANPKGIIRDSVYLKGIIFPHSLFDEYTNGGNSFSFCQTILQFLNLRKGGFDLELVLSIDWGLDIFPSIYDMFDFEIISFPINRKVEVCYRNLNSSKLGDNISRMRRSALFGP